jgi:hypothetical protein
MIQSEKGRRKKWIGNLNRDYRYIHRSWNK